MYRFLLRPKWLLFHFLVLAGVVVMVNLAFWQLRRLDERKDFNAHVSANIDAAPVGLADLIAIDAEPGDPALFDAEWRPVTASGEYLVDEQFVVVNRSQNGIAGLIVVTPLRLADDRILLVERGFVPLSEEDAIASLPPPEGEVEVLGRLRRSQQRESVGLADPGEGDLTQVQRIDIPRLSAQLPGDPVPMYVELIASDPQEPAALPDPLHEPTLSEGSHLSYTVQWFIFSLCAVVGWVFAVRRSIATRRVEEITPAPT
jgi:cytochrome oxidase assembly protein ShyY1